ncbi:MAG: hypothetical protein Q9168_001533 [Polycauliona sp. 1 TL-2023]
MLGEVALVPVTGGVFTVEIVHRSTTSTSEPDSEAPFPAKDEAGLVKRQLWDRKTQGGFPEIKELKRLVRDVVDPTRNLGHVDRHGSARIADDRTGSMHSNQPPNQSSNAENPATPTISVSPKQPKKGDAQSDWTTTAELAASRTAEKMVADIMHGFQEQIKPDESSARSNDLAAAQSNGTRQGAAQSDIEAGNTEDGTHSARDGCEDCLG